MHEPGLDRHFWRTEWEALEPLVVDSPEEALPEVDGLVERMLREAGYPLEDGELERTAEEGIDPDVLASFHAARDVATRAERGLNVDPAEIGEAVGLYRALYEHLVTRELDLDD
ncbi:MAG TPA: hypothetical protein VFR63_01495 [Gaiellaceae bacterium]|nr:hypothetical protein [Gaiellaceae bacterium]